QPPPFRPELFGHGVDERSGVVVGYELDLGDTLRCRHPRPGPDRGDVGGGNRAGLGPPVECRELDVEPPFELALFRPDPAHLGPGVAGDHKDSLKTTLVGSRREPHPTPRMRAASTAAFFALSTPTVARGTPGGI